MDARVGIKIFTVVREMLCNYYQSHNLIGPHPFWEISLRNSTFYTRPLLAGRHMQAGHEAKFIGQEDNLAGHFLQISKVREIMVLLLLHTQVHPRPPVRFQVHEQL